MASNRGGGWVFNEVLKRLDAVHGAAHSDLTLSPTCDAQCDTPARHVMHSVIRLRPCYGERVQYVWYGVYGLFYWQLRRALAVTNFRGVERYTTGAVHE